MKTPSDILLSEVLKAIDYYKGEIKINPTIIGSMVYQAVDPKKTSPDVVAYGFSMKVREVASSVLREKFSKDDGEAQNEMFELQKRYPCAVGDGYVLLDYMTIEDFDHNIQRLEKEANKKLEHKRALEAKKLELIRSGHFNISAQI